MWYWLTSILTFSILAASAIPAAALTPQEVVVQVQKKYNATGAFKAYFMQESRLRASGAADNAEGWVYFRKPCQMRWQYLEPPGQRKEVISDGRQVWFYIPQDQVAMVYPLKQVLRSDLVMRFFSGLGDLQKDFTISWNRPYREGSPLKVELQPVTPQLELKRLILTIDPHSYLIRAIEFTNAYGDHTQMTFRQVQLDICLEPDFFRFTPPPGVEVVEDQLM